jgi:chromosome segregation ATPase
MGENDMLKRDLNIERLRAEESRQAVKMAEESKQTLVSRYESELHEAAVNKTLLRRKERQLTDLKTQINGEKQRADSAVERERTWREAMEKTEEESKIAVERAHDHAAMMDGRVNTMSNHWKDQNAELQRTVGKMSKQINDLLELRSNDDRKIQTLRGVCEQQREMLMDLESKKDAIGKAFEAYKQEQEDGLRDIKAKAAEQEARNEAAIEETLEVLGKLKWALNVEKNVNFDRKV